MHNIDNPETLLAEADALYREGNHAAAALTYARSRQAALILRDTRAAFIAGVCEAESRQIAGELQKSLDMMFLLLAAPPSDLPQYEWWTLNKQIFVHFLMFRPSRARVQSLLADLVALSARQAIPASDVDCLRGDLEFRLGNWERSLTHNARGWQSYDGSGFVRSGYAYWACRCCLILGRNAEAMSWRQHLSMTEQSVFELARKRLKEISLLVSLEAGDAAAVRACVENGCGSDEFELRGRLFLRGTSTDLIDDPADPTHPARKLAVLKRDEDVHTRFENLLALVDYRLACLRFTAGLAAVDDLYYRQPDVLPKSITLKDPEKFKHQLHLFGISWRLLDRHARRIDGLIECDWRTKEAISRRQRCDAIAAACAGSLSATEPTVTTSIFNDL